ncbi:MAG: nicotinate-nucleotide adenylyltransferase [Prevotella sp.]|nr:nicotinate-nucleotide adenylyltransferase [Prevotella sp.]
MRIGIFGGSFNPIHNAHISLALSLLEKANLDKVKFVVSPQNPFKREDGLLKENIRLEMVKVALEDYPGLEASDVEFKLPRPSYTLTTLEALSKENPHENLVLLMGADNWAQFEKWYHSETILSLYEIVIYPRLGVKIVKENLPKNVSLVDMELINISSTLVREKILRNESIKELVPKKVLDIISSRGLYR